MFGVGFIVGWSSFFFGGMPEPSHMRSVPRISEGEKQGDFGFGPEAGCFGGCLRLRSDDPPNEQSKQQGQAAKLQSISNRITIKY